MASQEKAQADGPALEKKWLAGPAATSGRMTNQEGDGELAQTGAGGSTPLARAPQMTH